MSFREKSAWISLLSIAAVSIFFSLNVPWTLTPPSSPQRLRALLLCAAALVVLEIAAHAAVAIRAPQDARAPRDERDRLIDLSATRAAYRVQAVASLLAVSTIHLGANTIGMAYLVVAAFVLGALVKHGTRIFYHRRGI